MMVAQRGCVVALHLLARNRSVSNLSGLGKLGNLDGQTFFVLMGYVASASGWVVF
jgi:hypothetical protein